MKLTHFFTGIVLFSMALLLSACATLEVGVETTATPEQTVVATVVSDTLAAVQPTATVQPSVTPQPAPAESITPPNTPTQPTASETPNPTPASPYAGLVYRLGDQLFRLGPDGQPLSLATGLDPQILPGQYTPRAAFSADGKTMISWWDYSDLWLVDLTNGEATNLTNTPDRVEYAAQFWPARPDVIIFMSQAVADQGPGGGYLSAIQLDGSGYQVLDNDSASIGLPALSPDGQTIAYDRDGEPWLYEWDSGVIAINLADYNAPDSLKVANPTWSPKGKYLAWMGVVNAGSAEAQTGLALFDLEAHAYRLLHGFQTVGGDGWLNPPSWSPDGTWLALYDRSQAQPGIWVTHPDGSGERQVFAASSARSVAGLGLWWSPAGGRLLVYDPNAEGGGRAMLTNILTGQPESLPLPDGAIPLAWIEGYTGSAR